VSRRSTGDVGDLVRRAREGDPRAVARLISLVEDRSPLLREVMAALAPYAGHAQIVGITGSPGVGKSTSTSALVGNFGQANYMAAKFGIVGLSRGIALDMQRFKVRSNCIAPFAWTRMIDSIPAQTPEEKARVERFQQMTPEKIAPLTVYLASDRAEGISGQIFGVRNNEILLFSQPRPVRTLHRSEGWTPEAIDQQLKGALGPSLTPLERSTDVFSWDPV